jgi:hypothetical protein
MQVGGAHVRMIQHRPVIPKRINITGHEPNVIQIRMTERELELKHVPVSFFVKKTEKKG